MTESTEGVFIIGELADIGRCAALGGNFPAAVAFVRDHDLAQLPVGRHEIAGEDCYAIVSDTELVPFGERRGEVHHRYFDIQIPVSGAETYGIAAFDPSSTGSFDEAKDIGFYDQPTVPHEVPPGGFAVFHPRTCLHAPACTADGTHRTIRKIVIKVRG